MTCYDPDAFVVSTPKQLLGRNQQAFVDALKSGRYGQCLYHLHLGGDFCATGLAAHITGCDWYSFLDEGFITEIYGHQVFALRRDGSSSAIITDDYIALYAMRNRGRELSGRNDCGRSFMQIALDIEADPSKFFTESR